MKVVFACLLASAAANITDDYSWADYKTQFGFTFNSDSTDAMHKATFLAAMIEIAENNAPGVGMQMGVNQFTHLTQEEFKVAAGFGLAPIAEAFNPKFSTPFVGNHVHLGEALASSIDWEEKGAVTPVKDQGACGSCWSFSTTGGAEGAWAIAGQPLVSMSEQQLVDCDTAQNMGCDGGNVAAAYGFSQDNGVCTEASYGYKAVQGTCQSCTNAIPAGGITGFNRVGSILSTSVNDMKSALNVAPVTIAIQADQRKFQRYSGGILDSGCGNQLDHAVLMVGYGTETDNTHGQAGQEYFRIKNSWAAVWGDAGYIKVSTTGNVCGALNFRAVYPVVSSSVAV